MAVDDSSYAALQTPQPQLPSTPTSATLRPRHTLNLQVTVDTDPVGPTWQYPGMGTATQIQVPQEALDAQRAKLEAPVHKLGEWPSTAICGNDILSSVLYSTGLVCAKAGKLAPIPLVLVSVVLYFFRFIYEEVVSAIPLNGGSYNALLNSTSKRVAAFAAALGIISYLATGVVSGTSAVNYINREVDLPVVWTTVGLLFVFAVLNVIGIAESAVVALGIFVHHIIVLIVLAVASLFYTFKHTDVFSANMSTPLPDVDFAGVMVDSNIPAAIFFGFSAALLGITGFESSANFVEEQQPGVFRKTLRNMWCLVSVFNAVLSILAMGVLPMDSIHANKDALLAEMGKAAAGRWLSLWISIDAFIVLCGAVLTSYVGITGLMRRLAYDRVLPAFFMKQNQWRQTNHIIIFTYFIVASSLVILLNANTTMLAGVYTYAFLGLMMLFAFGCILMKSKRAEIPRDTKASLWSCLLGIILVGVGLFGNLLGDPTVLMYFALYLIVVEALMMAMLDRIAFLKFSLALMKQLFPSPAAKRESLATIDSGRPKSNTNSDSNSQIVDDSVAAMPRTGGHTGARGGRTITKAMMEIGEAPIIFFCKTPDMTIINKAILYVRKNEQTQNLRIVHVGKTDSLEDGTHAEFENVVALFDHIYPKVKIDFVEIDGQFEPAMVEWIAESMRVPVNMMFIAQPSSPETHLVARRGVRIITA